MMIKYTRDNLLQSVSLKEFNPAWAQRDFVYEIKDFLNSKFNAVLIIGGLRGMGKTVGMYQTVINEDALYLCSQNGEKETAEDYLKELVNTDKRTIIIDEYTWIKGRKDIFLERSLDALVHQGKRIILTGTESALLESLQATDLIHRSDCKHVTRFSYDEFLRINADRLPKSSQERYDMYLQEGGIFQEYVKRNAKTMDDYIRNSIVENIYRYVQSSTWTKEKIASAVYSVLFDAVHDIFDVKLQVDTFTDYAKGQLMTLGVNDIKEEVNPYTVKSIGEIMESIGVLIRVPNIDQDARKKRKKRFAELYDYRLYITNPAITWNLAKYVFNPINDVKGLLGRLFEAAVMVDLHYRKSGADDLYFYEGGGAEKHEIDAVLVPRHSENSITLIEVKHANELLPNNVEKQYWSIVTGQAEEEIGKKFYDHDGFNRYFVYTGPQDCIVTNKGTDIEKEFLLVGIDEKLHRYWDYEKNKEEIEKSPHYIQRMVTEKKREEAKLLQKKQCTQSVRLPLSRKLSNRQQRRKDSNSY